MKESHKTIINLRKQGYSYGAIAKAMDLSVNTVTTICRRNGIKLSEIGPMVSKREADLSFCKYCHQPFSNPWHRKQKFFCSVKCHDHYWNEQKRARRIHDKLTAHLVYPTEPTASENQKGDNSPP